MDRSPLRDVLARESAVLLAMPGVLGTGEGRRHGEPVFVVFIERGSQELRALLPRRIGDYEVDVHVPGEPDVTDRLAGRGDDARSRA